MARFRETASFTVTLHQRPTFHAPDATPFPPKPHPPRDRHFIPRLSHLSHLSAADDVHRLRRLAEDTELSIFDAERYFKEGEDENHTEDQNRRKGSLCTPEEARPNTRNFSVSSLDGGRRDYHSASLYATPTASSEASWNSRSGLLSNPPGSIAVSVRAFPPNEQRKGSSSACRWLLGRSCPCSGERSVNVKEKCSVPLSPNHLNFDSVASASLNKKEPKAAEACGEVATGDGEKKMEMELGVETTKLKLAGGKWVKEQDLFFDSSNVLSPGKQFPAEVLRRRIVNSGKPFKDVGAFSFSILGQPIMKNHPDDSSRVSLEVFRPPEEVTAPKKAAEFQCRERMQLFPGEGGPRRSFTFPPSPKSRVSAVEDDLSDSSSDLFEIESFSAQMTSSCPAYGRRLDSLDQLLGRDPRRLAGILQLRRSMEEPATPSVAASELYPPSEVSVEWSVTTAEGFGSVANFSSAASGCGVAVGFAETEQHRMSAVVPGGGKRRGGGLLSCRNENAVSVGPHPVRFEAAEKHHQVALDAGGFRATTRVGNGGPAAAAAFRGAAGAQPAPARFARSKSARVSRAFQGR